jgi:transposase
MERAEAEAILDGDRETAVALLMRIGELIEANRRLEARVAELEERLNRNSRNSWLPPSQDPPSAPPRPQKPGSGRRPGGQPGHQGRHRPLLPLERVDEVVDHWPERCRLCAHVFAAEERVEVAAPQRHQVAELPPIAVAVSEHRLHRLRCPACASETRAQLPPEVARSAFGPRLEAAVVTVSVRNRVSRRDASELRLLLEQAARKSTKTKRHRLFAKHLLKRWPALWTFTTVAGVEPTNNHAERRLRGAVIHRKLSLGSQSEHGERTIERLLSASITCRLQQRSLFAYLADVLSASIRGDPIPLLA